MSTPASSTPTPEAWKNLQGNLRWRFAEVELDESTLDVKVAGQSVLIEPKPLELLMYLLRHAGEVATKEELVEALWPGRIVTEASLTQCVAKLRRAIGDDNATLVSTQHGYGYRLAVPVNVETVDAAYASVLQLESGQAVPRRPNWKLAEKLGAGGFGEAWLGVHAKTGERRVFKFCVQADQLPALKREITLSRLFADALGEREDFARLLDWNLDEPPYYLEAEHCPQGSLAQWLEARGGAAAVPLALRLDCIAQAAETLAAAHALGVLHKDLKPSNLLVAERADGSPVIKLGDWGSGRLLDYERLRTAHITRLGFTQTEASADDGGATRLYQAPEVMAGQPATLQADIYALGVMLYQFIVGDLQRALAPGWEQDVDDELLREDIGAAAAGNPERRLGDARELALRLRTLEPRRAAAERQRAEARHQAEERAALNRARTRRKWQRALLASMAVGLGASTWLFVDARRARVEAEHSAAQAAEQARNTQAVMRFLTDDLLSGANPMIAQSGDVRVRDVLDAGAASLAQRFAGQPEALATVQAAIGEAYAALGARTQAEPLIEAAVAHFSAANGEAAPSAQRGRLALMELYVAQRDLVAFEAIGKTIVAAEEAAQWPNPEAGFTAAMGLVSLDCIRSGYAPPCPERARAIAERAAARLGREHGVTARADTLYGEALTINGQPEEAIRITGDALRRLTKHWGENHPIVLTRTLGHGASLRRAGRTDEALAFFRDLHARYVRLYGDDSPDLLALKSNLATTLRDAGQPDEALRILEPLYRQHAARHGETQIEVRVFRGYRDSTLIALGRHAEAITDLEALVALDVQENGAEHAVTRTHQKLLDEARQK